MATNSHRPSQIKSSFQGSISVWQQKIGLWYRGGEKETGRLKQALTSMDLKVGRSLLSSGRRVKPPRSHGCWRQFDSKAIKLCKFIQLVLYRRIIKQVGWMTENNGSPLVFSREHNHWIKNNCAGNAYWEIEATSQRKKICERVGVVQRGCCCHLHFALCWCGCAFTKLPRGWIKKDFNSLHPNSEVL